MSFTNARSALDQYSQNAVQAGIESASPHRLIQMLMAGMLDKVAAARGHMQRNEIQQKGMQVACAISILEGLKSSLDKEKGGDIAQNLEDLYIYMERRLVEGNRDNDIAALDEVSDLMKQIKEAWDTIGEQIRAASPAA